MSLKGFWAGLSESTAIEAPFHGDQGHNDLYLYTVPTWMCAWAARSTEFAEIAQNHGFCILCFALVDFAVSLNQFARRTPALIIVFQSSGIQLASYVWALDVPWITTGDREQIQGLLWSCLLFAASQWVAKIHDFNWQTLKIFKKWCAFLLEEVELKPCPS